MSGHRILNDLAVAPFQAADPGDAGTFAIDRDRVAYCLTVGASGETRTLPQPTKAGLEATVNIAYTAGGAVTLTVTGSYDGSSTTLSLDAAGDWVKLISVATSATAFQWRLINGGSGSSPAGGGIPGVTATAAELNYCDVTTTGTVEASKAVVVNATKDAGDFRNLDCVNLDAGAADGTEGTVDVFPTTASKGKLTIQCADNTDDHALILTNAAVATSDKTLTLPAVTGYLVPSTNALTAAQGEALNVTAGSAAASKAVVLDSSKNIATLGTVGCGTITIGNDDTSDGIVDGMVIGHSSSDNNATVGDGVGISLKLENATGTSTYEEWASIDAVSTTITNGTEDGDLVISTMLAGTVTEAVRIDASDQSLTIGRNATDANGLNQVRVFPLTASKGSLVVSAAANTTDHVMTVTNAALNGASVTVTLPALMGYAAISTEALTLAEVDVLDDVTPGTAAANKAVVLGAAGEIATITTATITNLTVGGTFTQTPLVTQNLTAGAAAAAVALRFGATATEGLEIKVIDETVNLTNAVETNLTETVPSGAVILSVQANNQTTVVGDASGDNGLVKVGIGTTADPDKYGKTGDLVQNTKIDTIPDWAVLSGAETVTVKGCDAAGDAVTEKFVADNPAGTRNQVRVRIVYAVCNSLDNAV